MNGVTTTALHVGPPPTRNEMRFARSEDFLVWIDRADSGRHAGAVVFGTPAKPYKVNLLGKARGSFVSWIQAVEFIHSVDLDSLS